MNRLIINNETELDDGTILIMISQVVDSGRISYDNQYCLVTLFVIEGIKYVILARKNKKSDRFTIIKDEVKEDG